MFSIVGVRQSHVAKISGTPVIVGPNETILDAALREGLAFPNVCRVGGCGTCRCKLMDGQVRETTDTGYLLSQREIDEGWILACQSRPRSDIAIKVELGTSAGGSSIQGKVVAKQMLTPDICRIDVQLDGRLDYRPGQFADLTFETLPNVTRSYSFSTAVRASDVVSFTIRRVHGGALSMHIINHAIVGERLTVNGPGGNFWMRQGDEPILMVGGGSGLSPLLAMLEEMDLACGHRPVTLLFGARAEEDLFALEQIDRYARTWSAPFNFVPVLSGSATGSAWQGRRGMVHDVVREFATDAKAAYLCGPPQMVDAVAAELDAVGIPAEHIHADRFVQRAAPASGHFAGVVGQAREPARLFDYLKFILFHAVGLASVVTLLAGGPWTTIGLIAILAYYLVGDAIGGDDTTTPAFRNPKLLTAQLWLTVPTLSWIVFTAIWTVSPGDPLGYGAFISGITGYDLVAARDGTATIHHFSGLMLTGLIIALIGTITAHELTHRTWDPISLFLGRVLLAFSIDCAFSIEHVYGHHRYVSTEHDPATAPRGRSVYAHILISTMRGNVSAWRIEKERLHRRRLAVYSWHNTYLRGLAMTGVIVALAYAMGGVVAALCFLFCAAIGKALLEIVNYMEHYGMVRLIDTPVEPRHSWNTNKRISSWTMFNLTRHSHHHAQGEVPFQDLMPLPDSPMMVGGYLTTIVATLVPPLWHRLMTPKVVEWDNRYAAADERELIRKANLRSGIKAFVEREIANGQRRLNLPSSMVVKTDDA